MEVRDLGFRIERAAFPVGSPARRRRLQRRQRARPRADDWRREDGPELVTRYELDGFGPELRREVDQIVDRKTLKVVRGRPGRKRLRRRVPLSRHVTLRNGSLLDRPHRLTGDAIEDVQPRLLGRLCDSLDWLSVDDDVRENRGRGDIVVPDPVMHELVMPLARARSQIEGDQRLAEQSRPRTMATVVIAGWQLHRKVDGVELLVDGDLSPHAGVPC